MTYLDFREASLAAVVAIPVRNERDRIGACLEAFASQTDMPIGSFGIVLFLNNCNDGTGTAARGLAGRIQCPVRIVEVDHTGATAGWARRSAMEIAAEWLHEEGADDGVILTTDADSRVPSTWMAENLACIKRGADAVAGRIALDAGDAEALPAALHARGRLEGEYEVLLTEIGARLDPEPWNPWPCHWTTSGASLAVRRTVYRRIGGMPALAVGEDRAFVWLLRSNDARVRHAPEIVVITSGRLDGRAPGGAADTMKLRCEDLDAICDDRLEPMHRALMRVVWRRWLRGLHSAGRLTETWRWSSRLGLSGEDAAHCAAHPTFSMAFSQIETRSPRLAFKPLRPKALPLQIALARVAVRVIRVMDRLRHAGRRSGSAPLVAGDTPARTPTNG